MMTTTYEFLLALAVGEEYTFPNKPTLDEARQHRSPTQRVAYSRIGNAITSLQRRNPGVYFRRRLSESRGSRIRGDVVIVTLVSNGLINSSAVAALAEEYARDAMADSEPDAGE